MWMDRWTLIPLFPLIRDKWVFQTWQWALWAALHKHAGQLQMRLRPWIWAGSRQTQLWGWVQSIVHIIMSKTGDKAKHSGSHLDYSSLHWKRRLCFYGLTHHNSYVWHWHSILQLQWSKVKEYWNSPLLPQGRSTVLLQHLQNQTFMLIKTCFQPLQTKHGHWFILLKNFLISSHPVKSIISSKVRPWWMTTRL